MAKNTWFTETFLPSFGFCKGKEISGKQGEIFIKYLANSKESFSSRLYWDYINGLYIELQESSVYNGTRYDNKGRHTLYRSVYFITIKKDTRKEREEIRRQITELDKKANAMYEESGNTPELDQIENKIDELENYLMTL